MNHRSFIPVFSSAGVRLQRTPWWFKPLVVIFGLLLVLLAIVFVVVAIPVGLIVGAIWLTFRAIAGAFVSPRPATVIGAGTPADPQVLDADDPARQNVRVRPPSGE
ncbi:MAG: hypothetical protein ACREJO_16055 [Phycisphaerales bacterium]